ncbi:MAG TPA: protein kinase, partial [Gemmatimonadaceae bacterium]|nr:protein kinase [Gemmatimonadaceae bacterium]
MSREQWLELEPLVDHVLELPIDQRPAYIADVRKRNAPLADELERFVTDCEVPDPRLDDSAPERFAYLLDDHLPAPLPQDTVLADRYLIRTEIGRGGMAIVYLASDVKLNHASVAVKVMRRGHLTTRAAKRFDEEIRLTSKLRHPNIVQLYDRGEHGDHAFFVMPYVEGETLRARLEREASGRLPIPEALRIGIEVARALDY